MKRETIITAAIFLAVGFLAGYITDAQINWSARQKLAQAVADALRPKSEAGNQNSETPDPPGTNRLSWP